MKKKRVKINYGRITMTIILVVLVVAVCFSLKSVIQLHSQQSDLKATNEQLQSDRAALQKELENVNDSSYIEEQARIQLRLIKPGEILYILNDDKDKDEKDTDGKDEDNN